MTVDHWGPWQERLGGEAIVYRFAVMRGHDFPRRVQYVYEYGVIPVRLADCLPNKVYSKWLAECGSANGGLLQDDLFTEARADGSSPGDGRFAGRQDKAQLNPIEDVFIASLVDG